MWLLMDDCPLSDSALFISVLEGPTIANTSNSYTNTAANILVASALYLSGTLVILHFTNLQISILEENFDSWKFSNRTFCTIIANIANSTAWNHKIFETS